MNPSELPPARLLTLAEYLPQGALLWGHEGWGVDKELAAETVEMLDAIRRQVAVSAGAKKARRQQPLQIKRPSYMNKKKPGRKIKSAGDLAAFFRGEPKE